MNHKATNLRLRICSFFSTEIAARDIDGAPRPLVSLLNKADEEEE